MVNTTEKNIIGQNKSSDVSAAKIGQALNLSSEKIEQVIAKQQETGMLFGEAAKALGLVTDEELLRALSKQFGFSYVTDDSVLHQSLIAAHKPFSSFSEKMKSLRGQLLIRWLNSEQASKTLAIVSTSMEDDASALAANLAITFSQLKKKTLLIDANLRHPKQHHLFGIETKQGLTNILSSAHGTFDLLPLGNLPNLTVLPSGTDAPNPQELLSRDNLNHLLSDLEKIYDVVLIDTAPSVYGLDYLPILGQCKASLLVAKKDMTEVSALHDLKHNVEASGAKLIGSVIQD